MVYFISNTISKNMNKLHKTPTDISNLNKEGQFCIYNRESKKNILFLGSCRHSPSMFYYSLLNPDINIFCIYVPFWSSNNLVSLPIKTINNILKSTDIIITETIRNHGVLNTDRQEKNNFFETFDCNHMSEIRVPNLHLAVYLYDVVQLCKKNRSNYKQTFDESMARLKRSIYSKGFDDLYDFIIKYFADIRMFYTFNHPSTIVSMLVFKILMRQLGQQDLIDSNFFHRVKDYNFLGGHGTPITNTDISTYNFNFNTKVFDDSIVNSPGFLHVLETKELIISDKYLDLI